MSSPKYDTLVAFTAAEAKYVADTLRAVAASMPDQDEAGELVTLSDRVRGCIPAKAAAS